MSGLKLIALDLDGTALDGGSHLGERTRLAIENAVSGGVFVVVASGRPYAALPAEVMEIPGICCAIVSNGAAAYDSEGRRIYSLPMPREKVEELLGLLEAYKDVQIEVYRDGTPYAESGYIEDPVRYGVPERAVPYIQRTRRPVPDIRAFARKHAGSLDSFDIIVKNEEDKERWRRRLSLMGGVYVTTSAAYRLETSNEYGGKAAALREICRFYDVRPEETAAFGNGENDLDMLRFAGTGVAVANSHPSLLEAADIIAPANTEDGVARVLEEMFGTGR